MVKTTEPEAHLSFLELMLALILALISQVWTRHNDEDTVVSKRLYTLISTGFKRLIIQKLFFFYFPLKLVNYRVGFGASRPLFYLIAINLLATNRWSVYFKFNPRFRNGTFEWYFFLHSYLSEKNKSKRKSRRLLFISWWHVFCWINGGPQGLYLFPDMCFRKRRIIVSLRR